MKRGDSVVVRQGVLCPDNDAFTLAGWYGRVTEVEPGEDGPPIVEIEWDSITVQAMPVDYIRESEIEGVDWSRMYLAADEVQVAEPRDTPAQTRKAIAATKARHAWDYLGEEGGRVQEVLAGLDPEDYAACACAWAEHLRRVVRFPFDAEVTEYQERGSLQSGDRVRVNRITGPDAHYGVIVQVKKGWRTLDFPLCDLEAVDEHSPSYQPVNDYGVWFANR